MLRCLRRKFVTNKEKKDRGHFQFLLAIDAETSGLFPYELDVSTKNKDEYYQAVSWGIIVADAETLLPIEKLYVEIKWDGKSLWNDRAEKIHGLSKEYLEEHGMMSKKPY